VGPAHLIHCHACGLVQRLPPVPARGRADCARCGSPLHRDRPGHLDPSLSLTLAGLVLFIVANTFPFLSLQMQGQTTETTLFTGVAQLYAQGQWPLAAVVGFTSILAPGLQLLLLLAVLVPLRLGRVPLVLAGLFRHVRSLAPWGMMDVFLLGILVAVVKVAEMATMVPGTALFAFVILIFVLAAAQAALDPSLVWSRIPVTVPALRPGEPSLACAVCDLLIPAGAATTSTRSPGRLTCPRCGAALRGRKRHSLQRTWALVLAACVLYVPANLYPIMAVTSLGQTQADTILSGALYLLNHGMWPLAAVVFVASILVPLIKLAALVFLLVSVQWRWRWRPRDRTRLYRLTEAVGRWSMVDIYVVTILVALIHLGNLANVEAQVGAVFFAAVVVLTLFAAMSFDPRLIWDTAEP
jgi:paraquat-inducible protein A